MTDLKHKYATPRVSTRGYYDLRNGRKLKDSKYFLYPKSKFNKIFDEKKTKEIVIFIHGMRNTRYGAKKGTDILRLRLRKLGYKKHPVIAFSYDADVRGAHLDVNYENVLNRASRIAKANGKHLTQFIEELRTKNPDIKIHLVGHSLGCEVIHSYIHEAVWNGNSVRGIKTTKKLQVDSIHLFGSPIETWRLNNNTTNVIRFINYYNPTDNELIQGVLKGYCKEPSCLYKVDNMTRTIKRYEKAPELLKALGYKKILNISCKAKDHRFRSYVEKLMRFP